MTPIREKRIHPFEEPLDKVGLEEKKGLLKKIEKIARKESEKIVHTRLSYTEEIVRRGVANSYGVKVEELIPRVGLRLMVVAEEGKERQASFETLAWTGGFEKMRNLSGEEFSLAPVKRAIELLRADSPPRGVFPAILSPEVTGILAHEALGHNLEGDHIINRQSLLQGKMGERIASPHVTLIDDPTYPSAYGSYFFDDEGSPARKKVLVREGKVVGLLHSLETALKLHSVPTGNARAQDYHHPPLVRMSNTYFLPGESSLEEMMDRMGEGILVEKVGRGGYVLPEKGDFMFNIDYSWKIEGGRKKKLLKNVSLAGNTLRTLYSVKEASSHFALSGSGGICGKEGQGVPVDDGGPYFWVEKILVGGRS